MASSAPSTPRGQLVSPGPRTDSPGTWRHPRFHEIQKRKNAAIFSERHLMRALWNGAALFGTFFLNDYLHVAVLRLNAITGLDLPYAVLFLRLYFIVNLCLSFRPLFVRPDTLADIPLTPSQRALLGLDPAVPSPSTPGNGYITPPKYRLSTGSPRSQTPQSGRSVSTPFSSSPLSGRGYSPTPFRTASRTDSYSPTASPLFQKAISREGQDKDVNRRMTFGSPSPSMGRSSSLKESSSSLKLRGTPSPTGRSKGANGGVNYKWLYERNAQSPNRGDSVLA